MTYPNMTPSKAAKIYPDGPELQFGVTTHGEIVIHINSHPVTRFQSDLIAAALNGKTELRNLLWLHVSKASPQGRDWPWSKVKE